MICTECLGIVEMETFLTDKGEVEVIYCEACKILYKFSIDGIEYVVR